MIGLLLLFVFAALNFLAIWKICDSPKASRYIAPVVVIGFGMLLMSGGLAFWDALKRGHHHPNWEAHRDELRQKFPLRSVADRLAYETAERRPAAGVRQSSGSPRLASNVEADLATAESHARTTRRGHSLEQVHGDESLQSTDAWMFPFSDSMHSSHTRPIGLNEPPPRRGCGPAREPEYVPQPAPSESPAPDYASTPSAPPLESLEAFHRQGRDDFLDPERFGYVRDRDHVAGFEPHAFHGMPALGGHGNAVDWKLEHLDLVSLHKPSGPHVYLSEHLPKVDALKTADTRLLDDFETRALSHLRTDRDVVIEESEGVVRMLGALRAGNHCTRCHAGSRGELIGAFSYEFHRRSRPPMIAEQ